MANIRERYNTHPIRNTAIVGALLVATNSAGAWTAFADHSGNVAEHTLQGVSEGWKAGGVVLDSTAQEGTRLIDDATNGRGESNSSGGNGAFLPPGEVSPVNPTEPVIAQAPAQSSLSRTFSFRTLTGVDVTCNGVAGTGEPDDIFAAEQPQLRGIGGWIPTGAGAARAAGVDTTPGSCR